MTVPGVTIHSKGAADIYAGAISLNNITPYVNESSILPFSIETSENTAVFRTEEGSITYRFRRQGDELIMSVVAEGYDSVHDVEPFGRALLNGATHVYYQGFGMEGPSGFRTIDDKAARSYGLIGLQGADYALAVFTTDHRRYGSEFSVRREEALYSVRTVFTAGINLEGTASGRIELPELHFIAGDDVVSCMKAAAERIAAEMDARTSAEPGFHWCSWYFHYENMSQQILDGFLADLDRDHKDFRYIQLDAGYTAHIGDWLIPNHRYPHGLGEAAASITGGGYKAGIWIAPFMVGDSSELYREHPDWVIHEKDGSPYVRFRSYTEPKIWGNTDNDYYVLDLTHPDAFAYLKSVFETFRNWGFTLYKADFLLWGMIDSSEVVRYDNSKTSVEIIRGMLAMVRDIIGEDGYLLGSIAPFMPCIGLADGMRIASDMGAQWTQGAFGPANLLQELPFDNYFNNIFWQNDPDSVILRHFASHLTETETRSIALLQALSGGIITTSDPVTQLSQDRQKLLSFIRPDGRVHAEFPFLTEDREEIVITHFLPDWNLFYVLNPTDHLLRIHYDLEDLFGHETFQYRFDWNDEDLIVSEKSSCFSETLGPHESALLFITEEPMAVKPSNLWGRDTSYYL
ncbi:MAG: alpha-galactosidase [Mogibacterium sp.]|nr:alpha-galactosidase [Mogibacterium sp.]